MKEKKSRKDHIDGTYISDIDAFHTYFAYLASNRTGVEVWLKEEFDVSSLLEYVKKKNEIDTTYKTTLFHAVLMATAKLLYHRPYLNRFIRNGRYYQRKKMLLSFVAKRQFADGAEESLMMFEIKNNMTIDDITKRVVGDVKKTREHGGNDADDILNVLQKLPGFIYKIIMKAIYFMDRHGCLPKFYYSVDPNFSSVLLSNLGSIKVDAPYHHLNNFGTNSVMMTIGEYHKAPVVNQDGNIEVKDVMNIGFTLDERLADGYYFSKSVRLFKYFLTHPELLDTPVDAPIDFEY